MRPTGAAVIDAEDDLTVDAAAALMLGMKPEDITSVGALGAAVDDAPVNVSAHCAATGVGGDHGFRAALSALVETGVRFDMMIRVRSGALVSAVGAPAGRRAVVRFRAATPQEAALTEALAAQREAEAQAEMMTAMAEGGAGAAFCLEADGALAWRSKAFTALSHHCQKVLLAEARAHPGAPEIGADADASPPTKKHAAPHPDLRFGVEASDGRTLHLALAPQGLPGGRILWLADDVSREVEAESAFRRFVHTMSDTFAHLKMSLMIFDSDRRLTLFNPATVDIIRIDAAWLAQRPTLKALLDRMRDVRVTPEQANYIEWRDRVLAGVAPGAVIDAATSDGKKKLEDFWHLANGRTLHVLARPHASGGLAVVIEDVSDTIALRRQSISERAVHVATTDILEEAVILFAPDGVARLSNAAFRALWGFEADAVAGRHVAVIARACRDHAPDDAFWDSLTDCVTGQRRRAAISAKLTLGDGRIMMARISPVPDGSVLAAFANITDSERIAAALVERNEALEQTQELRAALIDQISHQIRTPLNSISGFSQLLRDQHFGALNAQQIEYVDGIAAASRELLGAINGMTEIIDLEDDMTASPASGVGLLDEVVRIVNQRHGREVARVVPPEAAAATASTVAARRGHLRQIMFNLITDALSGPVARGHTPPGASRPGDEGGAAIGEPVAGPPLAETDGQASSPGGPGVAEVSIGLDGETLTITCRRPEDAPRAGPTLAFAMASRLARILGGEVTLEVSDGVRRLRCRTPVAVVAGQDAGLGPGSGGELGGESSAKPATPGKGDATTATAGP